ncbi:DUF3617 domain-containing protein [Caldimonas thermodepolymerans]|jgi:Protein of unknown function (DUF3617).|uniref:Uncharacterized protein DUF3617 n=1 Tax=Caldimonas thermodepolymerans TaxID=215580 RepID=A0A2S5T4S4_9BURK|nr:DUF3617 domain-containing protein [Caldimonas thermodepolymerans]PPE69994.1 hypothetical protein C1702_09045 [Caldimonas thermodepolymerans]QPC31734.1 DUF3617 domain-containing protein [Caldimonas thermodepolymerans]RDI01763.1 uncharacterized protein DUF3617 [Caldimonas thermodepolymerans]TCP05900.1 uncharacterized protein DUF3617 [Caldimonas thermodepolymerans]UZG44519.1 DUF3617 domain-containing protein [Caldimonas thermodepolymerans]
MTVVRPRLSLALWLACACAAVQAQDLVKRKPGLWEVQTRQSGEAAGQKLPSQAEMQAMLARLPAAQRAQMEKMMREQGVGLTDRPDVMRYCLSPEMAARDITAQPSDPNMKCEHKLTPVSATEVKFSFTCTSPHGNSRGDGRAWDITPEAYRTSMTMQGTMNGQPMSMKMDQTAKWLGSDCRGIKPLPN